MNAVGVGLVVGLGTIIGLALVSRDAPIAEYFLTFAFYGFCAGVAFEVLRLAASIRNDSRR